MDARSTSKCDAPYPQDHLDGENVVSAAKYKIIGGPRAGEFIVPDAPGMQRPPDAKPIAASDRSPLADAARQEAQTDKSYNLRPVTLEFPDGPPIKVYAPEDHTNDDVLRGLGLTASQRLAPDRHMIEAAVEMYVKPKSED